MSDTSDTIPACRPSSDLQRLSPSASSGSSQPYQCASRTPASPSSAAWPSKSPPWLPWPTPSLSRAPPSCTPMPRAWRLPVVLSIGGSEINPLLLLDISDSHLVEISRFLSLPNFAFHDGRVEAPPLRLFLILRL